MKPPVCKVCGAHHWLADPHDLTHMPMLTRVREIVAAAQGKPTVPTPKPGAHMTRKPPKVTAQPPVKRGRPPVERTAEELKKMARERKAIQRAKQRGK